MSVRWSPMIGHYAGMFHWGCFMTEERAKLISELRDIANHPQWGLVRVDVDAIRAALSEIKRLTRENADLKTKTAPGFFERLLSTISSQSHRPVIAYSDVIRIKKRVNNLLHARLNDSVALGRDDVKKEVIEWPATQAVDPTKAAREAGFS